MSKNTGLIADKLRSERVGPVTFHVAHNECLAITGASGSGKSLLLRLVADLDPHTGTLILDGENSLSMSGHVWRQRVAYFPAEPGWWSESVSDHIADTLKARTLIEAVGLPERMLAAEIRGLSTGERQRLALVRGLLHHPQVLLLDEPTSALDPQSTSLIEDLIMHQKNEGRIIVLVSHNAAQVERLADRRAILRDGRLEEVA